jgi:Na+-translocating ferredoxin:NAD+ oxidoreductase RnfC subunit
MARICTECGLLPCYVCPKGYAYKKCTKCISKKNKANRLKNIEAYREKAKATKERLRREAGARLRSEISAATQEAQRAKEEELRLRRHDAHVIRYEVATTREWRWMDRAARKEHTAKKKAHRNAEQQRVSEQYVRMLLAKNSILKRKEIPKELVLLKQAQIKVLNYINQEAIK